MSRICESNITNAANYGWICPVFWSRILVYAFYIVGILDLIPNLIFRPHVAIFDFFAAEIMSCHPRRVFLIK